MVRAVLTGLVFLVSACPLAHAAGPTVVADGHRSEARTSAALDSAGSEPAPTAAKKKKPDIQFGLEGYAGLFEPADPVLLVYGNGLYFAGHLGVRIKSRLGIGLSAGAFTKSAKLEDSTSTRASIYPMGIETSYRFKAPYVQPFLGLFLGAVLAELDPDTVTGSSTATSGISPAYGPLLGFSLPIGSHFATFVRVGLLQTSMSEGLKRVPVGGKYVALGTSFYLP